MFVWDNSRIDQAATLFGAGLSDYKVAAAIGVPRSTVRRWRHQTPIRYRQPAPDPNWRPPCEASYAQLLGLYLGDGCLYQHSKRSAVLYVAMDRAYPGLIAETVGTVERVFPGTKVHAYPRPRAGTVSIQMAQALLPIAFPQHGPGRKHQRKIELVDWQREITTRYPKQLLRGLIHSDGCRTLNTFKTKLPSGRVAEYTYPRYFFTNFSADIRGIFCEHCELLGIRWTQSNPRNISVSHRHSVAILDSFVGPKS